MVSLWDVCISEKKLAMKNEIYHTINVSVQLILLTMMLPTLLLRLTDLTIIRQLQSDLRMYLRIELLLNILELLR